MRRVASEVEEEEEHAFHEIDHIKSSRWGTKAGKKVVYYLVKFLDGTPNICSALRTTCLPKQLRSST